MGKKNLLNESTITRFMKLAAINENAAQAFVGTIQEDEEELVGDELAGAEDELVGDELAADDELAAEGGAEGAVKDMVDAVVGAISDVADDHGVQVDLDVQGADDELAGDELAGDELAAEEEPDLELEAQIRSIVAEMLNEGDYDETLHETGAKDTGSSAGDESATHPGEEDYTTKKGEKKKTSSSGRGEKAGDEAYINEEEKLEEDDGDLEESHGRGAREYSSKSTGHRTTDRNNGLAQESIQIVDDGILVQEVTNRVFTRLQKMLNERKKTK